MSRHSTLSGVIGTLACAWFAALAGEDASERLRTDRPVVKVLAPPGVAYLMQPSEDEKVVVVIEIIDATRQGLKTDDSGVPVFVAPDANVEAFARNIVYRTEYVDNLGHPVMQLTAAIPMKKLKTAEEGGISPPTDVWKASAEAFKKGVVLPSEALAPVAKLRFVVEDRAGMRSDARSERCVLFLGFPREVFVPPVPDAEAPGAAAPGTQGPSTLPSKEKPPTTDAEKKPPR